MPVLTPITGGGSLTRQNIVDINANFSALAGVNPGRLIYCWPSSGYLGVQDGSAAKPYSDLVTAYGAARNGMNDVVVLVGNGAASGSARLTATLTWSKDAVHLVGVCAPGAFSPRARVAPLAATTAFANFIVVSGNGCQFSNIEFFQGFDTGVAAEICVTVSGQRNVFTGCHFAGMGDTASATDTGSRNLKVSGSENTFIDCTVGLDTVARTVANASLEFASAAARNVFKGCIFPFYATNAAVLGVLGTGAGCVDRINVLKDCEFINSIKSGSGTNMTVLGSFTNAAPGGLVVIKRGMSVGITKFGDTNFLANSYIDMSAVSAAAGGLGLNPS